MIVLATVILLQFIVPLPFDSPYITMKNQTEAERYIAFAKYDQ